MGKEETHQEKDGEGGDRKESAIRLGWTACRSSHQPPCFTALSTWEETFVWRGLAGDLSGPGAKLTCLLVPGEIVE